MPLTNGEGIGRLRDEASNAPCGIRVKTISRALRDSQRALVSRIEFSRLKQDGVVRRVRIYSNNGDR